MLQEEMGDIGLFDNECIDIVLGGVLDSGSGLSEGWTSFLSFELNLDIHQAPFCPGDVSNCPANFDIESKLSDPISSIERCLASFGILSNKAAAVDSNWLCSGTPKVSH